MTKNDIHNLKMYEIYYILFGDNTCLLNSNGISWDMIFCSMKFTNFKFIYEFHILDAKMKKKINYDL